MRRALDGALFRTETKSMRRIKSSFVALIVLTATILGGVTIVPAQALDKKSSARGKKQAETIRSDWLKDFLSYVASDEMEGRDTPSRGLDLTAKFIALHLKQWGVKPAGDNGTYFQKIALRRKTVDPAESSIEFGGKKYRFGEDFLASGNSGRIADAPLVYLKNGWIFKEKNIDSYRSTDVRGKIVITYTNLPQGVTPADIKGKQGEDWLDPVLAAKSRGAVGIIQIPLGNALKNWEATKRSNLEIGTLAVEKFAKPNPGPFPVLVSSAAMLEALFVGEKINSRDLLNMNLQALTDEYLALRRDKKITIILTDRVKTEYTQNVVGVVEGSDAKLKDEYIAFGAHYDHVGTNPNAPGADKIWNGADDDGSGTVSILAMAQAFAMATPRAKRSALFVWHTGEEKGLWGAKYFSEFPTVPLAQIAAQLNIDMIGRSRAVTDTNPANKILVPRGEIYVIGSKKMSSELGTLSERVNENYLKLKLNYAYDDLNDPNRFFYRSDHFHYARKGIPIIFYFDGVYQEYHQPGDEVEKIDFEQMEMVARTIFVTGWELANTPLRPRVDKPLTAEEAVDPF